VKNHAIGTKGMVWSSAVAKRDFMQNGEHSSLKKVAEIRLSMFKLNLFAIPTSMLIFIFYLVTYFLLMPRDPKLLSRFEMLGVAFIFVAIVF